MSLLKRSSFILIVLVLSVTVSYAECSNVYSRSQSMSGKIALTFDDGPHATYTDEILDILAEYNVKATFFIIGENADMYPDVVDRILSEGHEVGSHTYSHCNICSIDDRALIDEVYKCENALGEYRPKLFRPPGGIFNTHDSELLNTLGYNIILWSVDTKDWTGISSDKIIASVRNNVTDGNIVLFHDYNCHVSGTPDALRVLIPELISQNYQLVTVSELLSLE